MVLPPIPALLLASLSLFAAAGCSRTWNLKITEVGKGEIELFLDADPSKQLVLGDIALHFKAHSGKYEVFRLGALGQPLHGGEFMMLWERGPYNGPPVSDPFTGGQTGSVPAIKVRGNLLDELGNEPCELYVTGSNTRYIFPFFFATDRIRTDIVRFGQPTSDRPVTFTGGFSDDGSLLLPTGSLSLQRKWSGSAPLDTDHESDWKQTFNTWGVPTN